jgi:hypothetical protein
LVEQRSSSDTTGTLYAGHISRDDIRRALLRANRMDMHCVHSTNGRRQRPDRRGRRNGALRLCFGIWDGMVHVSVHNGGAEPTATPKVTSVPSTGTSSLGRSGRSSLSQLSILSAKVELRSIASKSGVTAQPGSSGVTCRRAPAGTVATWRRSPLRRAAYTVAAYVLPSAGRPPSAASFPKTPTVLTPLIQNERSQDHGPLPKEPKES